jgi:hypothetical protein
MARYPSSREPMSAAPRPSRPPVERADPPPEYEFTEAQKESFRALAQSMSFVGVSMMLLGGLGGAIFGLVAFAEGFAANGVAVLVGVAVWIPMAWWMMSAGRSLGALVRTHGRDVHRVMEAVGSLRLLFGFARVVILVFTLAVVLVAAGIVWCTVIGQGGGKCFGAFG